MKITPLEIRQKDFEKKLRGYDKDEVSAFLLSLSNEWERVLDESKELKIKLEHAEKEVKKMREVESSLYKTLKTAEDTGANLIDQSNKAAELHMKETQMKAEALMNEAKSKSKAMMEKAEMESRQIIEELQDAVNQIEQNRRDIENHRHNAIAELKNLSVDLIEKVERTSKAQKEFRFEDYIKRVKELARESGERIKGEDTSLDMPETPKIEDAIQTQEDKIEVEEEVKNEPILAPVQEEIIEKPVKETLLAEEPVSVKEKQVEKPEEVVQEVEPEKEVTAAKVEPESVNEPLEEAAKEPEPETVKDSDNSLDLSSSDGFFEDPDDSVPEKTVEKESPSPKLPPVEEPKMEKGQFTEVINEDPPKEEVADSEEEVNEKPGPRIARTVSFFDELDDEE